MRLYAETGTDAATLAAGDPAVAAPWLAGDPGDGLVRAARAGALWSASTGGDGAFLVLVLVDEDPPPELAPYLRDPLRGRLELPAGVLRVAGAECFAPGEPTPPRRGLGEDLALPPGAYALEAFRVEAPPDALDAAFAARAGRAERAAWRASTALAQAAVAAGLATIAGGGVWAMRAAGNAPASAALAAWPAGALAACLAARWLVNRTGTHRSAAVAWRAAQRELPSVVLALRRAAAATATPEAAPPRTARS